MGYYIDLNAIQLEDYMAKLKVSDLLPSRVILKENLDERLNYFKSIGIKNIRELLLILRKKEKLAELAKVNCLSEKYLVILLRELNSIQP